MAQHGAETTIGNKARLVIFDCYETLVHMDDRQYRPRNGILTLLRHLRRDKRVLAVLSDGERAGVEAALAQAEMSAFFERIFTAEDACQQLDDGRLVKRLDVPMNHFGVTPDKCVFIGDSPLDSVAAMQFQVPFIRVPRSEDASFSFSRLIGGASRYSSAAFNEVIIDKYRKGGS